MVDKVADKSVTRGAMDELQKSLKQRSEMMNALSNVMAQVQAGGVVPDETIVMAGIMGQASGMSPQICNDMVRDMLEQNHDNTKKQLRHIR